MEDLLQDVKEDGIGAFLERLNNFLEYTLVTLGSSKLTVGLLIALVFSVFILVIVTEWIKKIIVHKVLTRYQMDIGTRQSVGTIIRYVLLIGGFVIIIQNSGIDLSALGILAGALGVGIGFGLQNITNNFISGLIILFERPIKVGDRIEVGDVNGDVIKISSRSTMIVTNDNISIIVPNSQFIDSPVIN